MNKILAHVICKYFGFHFILIKEKTAHFRNLVCVFVCVCIYIYIYIYIYTIVPKVLGHPLLMKGLTTLVISMSTNLNV